jgi:glutaredoxin 3
MPKVELYGTATCAYTREMRESLEWRGTDFVEYDVDADREAYDRMLALSGGQRMVPVLVEAGKVVSIGWQGRGCVVGPAPANPAPPKVAPPKAEKE